MASLLNSKKDISANFTGQWEDIKDYTSVIMTLQAPVDGSATIEWANTTGRTFPTDSDIIASENFTYSGALDASQASAVTKQFDHRARWFRVRYDHSGAVEASFSDLSFNFETLYKKAPTELKIVDDSANVVSVNVGDNNNSLYTMLTDASGVPIRTTNDSQTTGEALYVHLADGSGNSLATTETDNPESLFVGLRDASNVGIDSTGSAATNNALYVRPGDVSGNAQASTFMVSDAYADGVALYGALADNCGHQINTTNNPPASDTSANALYVHLTLANGNSVSSSDPLPVVDAQETVGALPFDVSYGIEETFVVPAVDMSSAGSDKINLYNIFVYNDSPVTIWLKLYDVSTGTLSGADLLDICTTTFTDTKFENSMAAITSTIRAPIFNITVPGGRTRDINLPGGATFNNGVYARATTQYKQYSTQSPGANLVFLNGSYTKE